MNEKTYVYARPWPEKDQREYRIDYRLWPASMPLTDLPPVEQVDTVDELCAIVREGGSALWLAPLPPEIAAEAVETTWYPALPLVVRLKLARKIVATRKANPSQSYSGLPDPIRRLGLTWDDPRIQETPPLNGYTFAHADADLEHSFWETIYLRAGTTTLMHAERNPTSDWVHLSAARGDRCAFPTADIPFVIALLQRAYDTWAKSEVE